MPSAVPSSTIAAVTTQRPLASAMTAVSDRQAEEGGEIWRWFVSMVARHSKGGLSKVTLKKKQQKGRHQGLRPRTEACRPSRCRQNLKASVQKHWITLGASTYQAHARLCCGGKCGPNRAVPGRPRSSAETGLRRRREFCHSAAPPSPSSRRFNRDGKGVQAK